MQMQLDATERAFMRTLRAKGFAVVVWVPADIQSVRESWSEEKCADALLDLVDDLQDRAVESGWGVLDTLLPAEEG